MAGKSGSATRKYKRGSGVLARAAEERSTSNSGEYSMHERRMRESLIEKYVGFPDSLDADTRAAVEAYIRENDTAQKVAEFYRTYYAALRGDSPHSGDGADPSFDPSRKTLGPSKG